MSTTAVDFVDIPAPLHADASFLCGGAGTGKTYLARQIVRQWPGTVLAASTGIASVNLGEGTTINALLGYFDTASMYESFISGQLTAKLGKLYRSGVRRIILDEISMVAKDQLTYLTRALDELSGRAYTMDAQLDDEITQQQEQEGDQEADGGRRWPIKLVLVGDFAQLPPVRSPFAFESDEWARYDVNTHTLTEVRRQAEAEFIEALWAARRGAWGPVTRVFGPRLAATSDPYFPGLTIFAKNEEVDRYNALRLDKVQGRKFHCVADRWGKPRADWKNIPDRLDLKIGATVMILANAREEMPDGTLGKMIYANGDLGEVVDFVEYEGSGVAAVHVELRRNNQVVSVVAVTRNHEIPLEPGRKTQLKAEGNDHRISTNGKMEIIGTVEYMPLRVAYGSTVHKCQGLSLDEVQVNTRDHFFKTPGMLYVALSRCRSLDGLRIVGTVEGLKQRCTVDPKIRPWV
jgi:hypothetical protein